MLTWKDVITTLFALGVLSMFYAFEKGISIPLISGVRISIIAMAVLGIGMCAFSSADTLQKGSLFTVLASGLGILAAIFIVYGLITGAKLALELLTLTMLLLWVLATFRHIIGMS